MVSCNVCVNTVQFIRKHFPNDRFKLYTTGPQIFQNSSSNFRILGTRRAPWSKFHIEDSHIIRCHCTKPNPLLQTARFSFQNTTSNSSKDQTSNGPCLDRHYWMWLCTEHASKVMPWLQTDPVQVKQTRHWLQHTQLSYEHSQYSAQLDTIPYAVNDMSILLMSDSPVIYR